MNTKTAKAMAAQRHRYPEDFLKELESEIGDIEGTVIGVEKQMKNYNEKEIVYVTPDRGDRDEKQSAAVGRFRHRKYN